MDSFRFDARQLDNIDIQGLGTQISGVPRLNKTSGIQESALRGAINLSGNRMLADVLTVADGRPPVSIIPPTSIPVGLRPGSIVSSIIHTDLTVGFGLSASASAVMGITVGGGVYDSTTPELGVYGSVGGGWWTNVQASIGPTLTFVFGPPSDFAGVSWGVGVDVSIPGGIFGLGGMILFTMPPVRLLGFAYGCTIGASVIPVDVTVQVSQTSIRPLLRGR